MSLAVPQIGKRCAIKTALPTLSRIGIERTAVDVCECRVLTALLKREFALLSLKAKVLSALETALSR